MIWRLRRKIHSSWLVTIGCAAIFAGVLIAQYVRFYYFSSFACIFSALVLILIVLWRRYIYLIPIIIIGGLMLGLWRGSLSQEALAKIHPLVDKSIVVRGCVKDDVDVSDSNQIIIRLNQLSYNNSELPGTLWVSSTRQNIKRGDILAVSGKLDPGFGNFSGVMYRAKIKEIIHPVPGDVARQVRDWFAEAVRRVIDEPEASLGIGYLVGQRRALPNELITALKIAGLTHIVVASGYNLTILVRLTRRLFSKISKYLAALSAVVSISVFVLITGISPSMTRAGIVAGLSLAAWYYGRKFHPITLLSLAIALTLLIDPSYAWGDLGWQLLFLAFAGVMVVAPLMSSYFLGDKKPDVFGQILVETISAQLMTVPVILLAFGQLSNVAIISNLLILPLVPFTMLLTFVAGVASLAVPISLAVIIAMPATWALRYMVFVAEYLADLPWAISEIKSSWLAIAAYYFGLAIICLYLKRVTEYNLREVNIVE